MPMILPVANCDVIRKRLMANATEAFASEGRELNLLASEWEETGYGRHYESTVTGVV
jgi:hypothetical protein